MMSQFFRLPLLIASTLALGVPPSPAAVGFAEGSFPAGQSLEPSFTENFDGSDLRTSIWQTAFKPGGTIANRSLYGNRERQIYFDPQFLGAGVQPFSLGSGILTITAQPMPDDVLRLVQDAVAALPANLRESALKDVRYSSGLITTKGRFDQRYGYFEMRARWTGGRGIWPAFWLLPSAGGWPPEIDIVEAHGDKPLTAFSSMHSKIEKAITRRVALTGTTAEFHRYGVLWTPTSLDYYIDGTLSASIPAPADMNGPMYMIANLAIGGTWPGDPDATTIMPAKMEIDYIRAWRFPAEG